MELLEVKKAASFLGVSVFTLSQWRSKGRGPAFVKVGKRIRYDIRDLDSFLQENRIIPGRSESNRNKIRRPEVTIHARRK